MRIPRIYTPDRLEEGAVVVLDETAARHLIRVLRLGPGAPVILFDGRGGEYQCSLVQARKGTAQVAVGCFVPNERESSLQLCLAQGISRHERMDFTIQKAVELGVAEIVPLQTARTVVQLTGSRIERRRRHWQSVAIGACEQCGRNRIPRIHTPRPLADWLPEAGNGVKLLLDPAGAHTPTTLGSSPNAVTLLVGPEGGLTNGERVLARDAGYVGLRLGLRVLRTETAAIAAVAILQAIWGDLST